MNAVPQLMMLLAAALAYVAAGVGGLRHLRTQGHSTTAPVSVLGPTARVAVAVGTVLCAALALWRTMHGQTPLASYFDAFLSLAILLMLLMFYFRLTKHLRSFCIFLLPMIAAVLLQGAALQVFSNRPFDAQSALTSTHIIAVLLGVACLAVCCVGAIIYLFADRQLRQRQPDAARFEGLPSLARIERFNHRMLLLGFPLLTVAMITGTFLALSRPSTINAIAGWSKVGLAALAWAIFGFLLAIRIAPAFRGRRAAQLAIAGFVALLLAFIAVSRIPHR